jgi:hypothetical protein
MLFLNTLLMEPTNLDVAAVDDVDEPGLSGDSQAGPIQDCVFAGIALEGDGAAGGRARGIDGHRLVRGASMDMDGQNASESFTMRENMKYNESKDKASGLRQPSPTGFMSLPRPEGAPQVQQARAPYTVPTFIEIP